VLAKFGVSVFDCVRGECRECYPTPISQQYHNNITTISLQFHFNLTLISPQSPISLQSLCNVTQCVLEHVEGGRISNKKYDAELLHPVTQAALTSQGIPEAYTWLEACVAQEDIAVGRSLEVLAGRGTLGRLHEVGAGHRVAPVHIMEPSPHLADPEKFWRLPADVLAMPLVHDESVPLPNVRYKDLRQVPDRLLAPEVDSGVDSDDRPLSAVKRPRSKVLPRKQAKKRKKPEEKEPALSVVDVRADRFVVTNDDYGTKEKPRPGFAVCQIVGNNIGTADDPSWSYKHLLSSKQPHVKAVVDAKFGLGRGSVVDALEGEVVHFYTVVAVFDSLNRNGQLPKAVRSVIKEHSHWAVLE
jgi:hypothetical protein